VSEPAAPIREHPPSSGGMLAAMQDNHWRAHRAFLD
jgi:hypothetical protein